MFSTKYRLVEIADRKRYNPLYEDAEGSICYLAYFKVGERGWFLYEAEDDFFAPAHRLHTSEVQSVELIEDDDGVVIKVNVQTKNATYKFEVYNPEEASDVAS